MNHAAPTTPRNTRYRRLHSAARRVVATEVTARSAAYAHAGWEGGHLMGKLAQQYAKNTVPSRAGFLTEVHHAMTFNQRAALFGRTDLHAYRPAGNGLSDVVIVDARKVVAEAQIKNMASAGATRKALNDARYAGMQRVGPRGQPLGPDGQASVAHGGVHSRPVSHEEMKGRAAQEPNRLRRNQQLRSTLQALGLCAVTGAAMRAAPVARECYRRWKRGEMTASEARRQVLREGARGAGHAVVMGALAAGLSAGLKATVKARPEATSVHGATWNEWGSGAATFALSVGADVLRLQQRRIDHSQFRWRCVRHAIQAGGQVGGQVAGRVVAQKVGEKAGAAMGNHFAKMAASGATTGGALGMIVPGLGNVVGAVIGAAAGIGVALVVGVVADAAATTVAPDSKTGHGRERNPASPVVYKHLMLAIREDADRVRAAAGELDAVWKKIPASNMEGSSVLGARMFWEEQLSEANRARHPHPEADELRAELKWLQEGLKTIQRDITKGREFLHDLQAARRAQEFFTTSAPPNFC